MKCFISIINLNCNLSITFPDHHFGDNSNKYHPERNLWQPVLGALTVAAGTFICWRWGVL